MAKCPLFAARRPGEDGFRGQIRTPLLANAVRHEGPRVALPRSDGPRHLSRSSREDLPGFFPFTAGVFPFKRQGEAPARMFAGEGDAFRTNRRFRLLSRGSDATRLSTAFDSVTLYGPTPTGGRTSTAR